MDVAIEWPRKNAAVVIVSGEVDLQTSPRLRDALLSCFGDASQVIVDLSGVEYIDSSGITSLLEGYQDARSKQASFSLAGVSEGAMRVLRLARLDKVLPIGVDVETVLAGGN
ncbi:MAG: STAS domain-containing protein [Rhodospirillaceae bacterium]